MHVVCSGMASSFITARYLLYTTILIFNQRRDLCRTRRLLIKDEAKPLLHEFPGDFDPNDPLT